MRVPAGCSPWDVTQLPLTVMPHKDKEARAAYQREYNHKNRDRRRENKRRSDQKLMAERMIRNKEQYHADPEVARKRRARVRVNLRVNKGLWPRASFFKCSDCDAQARDYHHEDYAQWWNVEPLCKLCHSKRHQGN